MPPKPPPPTLVSIRLVYKQTPGLLLLNNSTVVTRDIKWNVGLWNMNRPDDDAPLPIPTGTFDWLKPNSAGGPMDLFSNASVAVLLRKGDHLIGTIGINCPACERGRTYVVSIIWGQGGWYAEVPNEKSGELIVPGQTFSRPNREKYFAVLEAQTSGAVRIPIS